MKAKFPHLWVERMGSSCYDENGNFTSIALNWAHELSLLTPEMVKIGLRDLSHLPNPTFPPSAIEFIAHCRNRGFFDVQDEVLRYINRNDKSGFVWSGLVPWNVYFNLHHNPNGKETHEQLRSRIEKVYKSLSWHDLKPLPIKREWLPEKQAHPINNEKGYAQFIARVAGLLSANEPDINEWSKKLGLVFPDLVREWWPEFKQCGLSAVDFLRDEKGLNIPKNHSRPETVREIMSHAFS